MHKTESEVRTSPGHCILHPSCENYFSDICWT